MQGWSEHMSAPSEPWWSGNNFPVRAGCRVEPLIDGRAAFFAMCRAFLNAKEYILLAAWDIQVELRMIRGEDAHIGEQGGQQRQSVIATLQSEGFDEDAIAMWLSGQMRVIDVLGLAVSRGVRVGVLLWDAIHLGSHITNDPHRQRRALESVGVDCLLDDSSRHVTHVTQALHQKCAVVDGKIAFVGGVDLTAQDGGDYDRWDTHHHPCASSERLLSRSATCHPWHDVHTRIEGPAVIDVQRNITQRWAEVSERHQGPRWPTELQMREQTPLENGVEAQITRTIPPSTYAFAPQGIATIKEMYLQAVARAREFIYLENQYLWPEVFLGLDELRWGERSPDMVDILECFAAAMERGVSIAITLPDHPNCGRRFTDGGVEWLRQRAETIGAPGRFNAFTLGNSERDAASEKIGLETTKERMIYRPVYTHAKVAIVDDHWWSAGSANLNSRGMRSDAEINVCAFDPLTAHDLRLRLWTEHLRRTPEQRTDVEQPLQGIQLLKRVAEANRELISRGEPLHGHILPYMTVRDGAHWGIDVHPEHGWLDMLEHGAGAIPAHHAGRYI